MDQETDGDQGGRNPLLSSEAARLHSPSPLVAGEGEWRPHWSPRDLAKMSMDFTVAMPNPSTAPTYASAMAGEVVDGIKAGLNPLMQVERGNVTVDPRAPMGFKFTGDATVKLVDALRPLGLKINPTMSGDQAGAWIAAMVASLGDLPVSVVVRAANDALHVPIRFFPEVEGVIRDKAAVHVKNREVALIRLRRFQRDIAEAGKTPLLEAPAEPPELTVEGLRALGCTTAGRAILSLGLAKGYITQEQYDEATALPIGDGADDVEEER